MYAAVVASACGEWWRLLLLSCVTCISLTREERANLTGSAIARQACPRHTEVLRLTWVERSGRCCFFTRSSSSIAAFASALRFALQRFLCFSQSPMVRVSSVAHFT